MEEAAAYDIVIIGGGLSGLSLGYLLRETSLKVLIIEGRSSLGGRIETYTTSDGVRIELGATWLGKKHTDLTSLLDELGLETIPQYMGQTAIYEPISTSPHMLVNLPPNDQPSYRIKGGTSTLIETLAANLTCEVSLGELVTDLHFDDGRVDVTTSQRSIRAKKVVSTLPPYLLYSSIGVTPHLPIHLTDVMMTTHTWMSESIKVGLTFSSPFWLEEGTSGTIVSNVGPIPEMYDHSNEAKDRFALKGFLNGSYASLSQEERKEIVLAQLTKYYGDRVKGYSEYIDKTWRHEELTHVDYSSYILPHQNNGHEVYATSYFDDRLWIAGAETATAFPGYMNGAVVSANSVYKQIVKTA